MFNLGFFYYNALGAFFDALIQRTDGCTEFLWLLMQPHHSIHCSYKRYINRYLSQHMIFQYQDEDSGEPIKYTDSPEPSLQRKNRE